MNLPKWFFPGLGVKRWFLVIILGFILISIGITPLFGFDLSIYVINQLLLMLNNLFGQRANLVLKITSLFMILAGISLTYYSLLKIRSEFNTHITPNGEILNLLYEKRRSNKGPEIVAFGGGTGLSNLLRGLKKNSDNLTAVVTVADDGGSSGRLRDEMGILPPGDIRNCLVALADREPLMEKLFQHRFESEGGLEGHSFGNLYIAAMTEVLGDFEEAVRASSKVLAIRGKVLPATNEDIKLGAVYHDQEERMGESAIPVHDKEINKVFLYPENASTTPEVKDSIQNADVIIIGPGSLYTSILPNLLVKGIGAEIKKTKALKLYICNVMTQPGETDNYTAADHAQAIIDHCGSGLFDYIVVNNQQGTPELRQKYAAEGAYPVQIDHQRLKNLGLKIIEADLLKKDSYLRHDPEALAELIYRMNKKYN
ncbi:MAG: uridine diphosphate-N-acetylglucosamine-binding protein YvcK [Halanaerobium sp.]